MRSTLHTFDAALKRKFNLCKHSALHSSASCQAPDRCARMHTLLSSCQLIPRSCPCNSPRLCGEKRDTMSDLHTCAPQERMQSCNSSRLLLLLLLSRWQMA